MVAQRGNRARKALGQIGYRNQEALADRVGEGLAEANQAFSAQ